MKNPKKTYTVYELNEEQKTDLKRFYWNDKKIKEGKGATFADFERINELVSDEELFKAYSRLTFDDDDFVHW